MRRPGLAYTCLSLHRACLPVSLSIVSVCLSVGRSVGLSGVMSERLARKLRYMAFTAMLRREISWFDRYTGQAPG